MNSSGHRSLLLILALSLAQGLCTLASPFDAPPQQKKGPDAEKPTSCTSEIVLLNVTVEDASRHPVEDLRHEDFTVFDKDEPQQIAFFTDEDYARKVAIVVDRSISRRNGYPTLLDTLIESIGRMKEDSNALNEYFIIGADGSPKLVTDWTRGSLIESFSQAAFNEPAPYRSVYDSCRLALEKLEKNWTNGSVILLIGDGHEAFTKASYRNLRKSVAGSGSLFYSISLANVNDAPAVNGLKTLAAVSGGGALFTKSANELSDFLSRVAIELRHQYRVGYYPIDNKHNGKWHSINVVASNATDDRPGQILFVRTCAGYYAPKPTAAIPQ